ncbi:restriction endonuclease subunit S, partial [Kaistella sp.]|uniref:restriction endonuclease subunit S n=1 Tax=Kaistella sp. TaxID=2782235 RepID=UPI003C51926D
SFPKKGDILISAAGTIGRTVIYNGEDAYFQDSNIVWIENDNTKITNEFLFHVLQIVKYNTEGGTIQRLYNNILKSTKFSSPTIFEQTKIANFLSLINERIATQKKTIEELESLMKGVSERLFSQKLRFKEFTDDWKEKYLGDISKITTGKLDANAMVKNGEYRFYTCAKEYYQIDKYAFDTEALLISGNGANVGYIHYYKGKFNAYQRTYVLDKFEENITYIKFFLDNFLQSRIYSEKKEGNTPYIVLSTLSEMEIRIPSHEEQTKIANFLSAIDNKIETEKKILSLYELQKKYLLINLFV